MSLSKAVLEDLYQQQKLSMAEIAMRLGCSPHKVVYWMNKHGIRRRDIREAIYRWHNPSGDPFDIRPVRTPEDLELLHIAIGLYVGEGSRKRTSEVSVANSDPRVICAFIRFLRDICGVDQADMFAIVHMYDDVELAFVQHFWEETTGLAHSQFHKPTIKPRRGGTYKARSRYGTVTVGVYSTKLHQIIQNWCNDFLNKQR